ncbi:hypothetical protein ACNKHO_02575 [Shigella flexneri]
MLILDEATARLTGTSARFSKRWLIRQHTTLVVIAHPSHHC